MLRYLVETDLASLPTLCRQAGDGYAAASRAVVDEQLSILFATLATSRRAMALGLCHHLDLPARDGLWSETAGHTSPEDLGRRLFGRLRAVLGGDERRTVIEGCERMERALAHSLAEACEAPVAGEVHEALRRSLGEVLAAMGLLAAARVRLS